MALPKKVILTSAADVTGILPTANTNTGTTSGTIPVIGAGNKLPASIVPSISSITFLGEVANQAARTGLAPQTPPVSCFQVDTAKLYLLTVNDGSSNTDWEIWTPTAQVASAVTFTPVGTIAATECQSAIAEAASEACQKASNLSDVANAGTSRTNLGLGTMAVQAASAIAVTGGTLTGVLNSNPYIKLTETQAANTQGGGTTAGATAIRALNLENSDVGGFCTLASNQFTLTAGTYEIYASAPAYYVNQHRIFLYNATGAAIVPDIGANSMLGSVEYSSNNAGSFNGQSRSFLSGRFTIAGAQALEIRHYTQATRATDGFGVAANENSHSEVYTIVELWRVA